MRALALGGCSVPGVFPPVTIDGRRYMDGGSARSTNSDLVADHDEVLVISPMTGANPVANARVIMPDRESLVAMMPNVLDSASRVPSAEASYRQGRGLRL
ncbi:patatin-like phospholipase family protein [Actinosynnema sp. ALI-1.44]|uniref:patatin-like phospholipase family protein n=1 Tax=Actinosynnema sp. ALI-1.44 TaxID=1933779 RepID=UPI0011778C45|nr:patatin-like phospholipase family protein [Actinosynnema sp. ALI-1.44]